MRQILNIITFISINLIFSHVLANDSSIKLAPELLTWEKLPFKEKIKNSLKKEPYAKSTVESFNENNQEKQKLDLIISGLHKKPCDFALVKLAYYERYSEYVGFIEKSTYDQKTKLLKLYLEHVLLPFDMTLQFKIQRITDLGIYRFRFDRGFLKNLEGTIHVAEHTKRCLITIKADWQGPSSSIPDTVFSFFSQALGKKGVERLFRASETL